MSPVLQTFPLGPQWPTLDPFLFCAHHLDRYPAGDGDLAPSEPLTGRNIGMDFESIDGWNMYHGSTVPGFPSHPHRGFETVTYVRRGWCDHSDSLGAAARFGEGDVQWVTAGGGIVHSEMFPLTNTEGANTLHLFQIWLNLPAANKLVDPYFSMLWNTDIPKVIAPGVEVTVLAGSVPSDGRLVNAPTPPPDSWAAEAEHDVNIWHLRLDPDAVWTLPPAAPGSNRVLYLFEGEQATVSNGPIGEDGTNLAANTGALLDGQLATSIRAGADSEVEALLLQGRPIGEPVAQRGPFVMNAEHEIRQAMLDYQQTQFGGWPWPNDDPTHGPSPARFARYGDGRIEQPDSAS